MSIKISKCLVFVSLLFATLSVFVITYVAIANPNVSKHMLFTKAVNDDSLVCNYDFYMQNKQSTIVPDISGHENAGNIKTKGEVRSYQILENEDVLGRAQWSFAPNGGYDGTYLEIPKDAFIDMNKPEAELSASIWVNLTYLSGYQRIFDFGNGTSNYLYVLNCGQNWGFQNFATAIKLDGGQYGEEGFGSNKNLPCNAWCLVTVTMDKSGILKLYKDKDLIGQAQTESSVQDLAKEILKNSDDDSHCYVAASNYNDPCTSAKFCDFRLYSRALSSDEIADLYYPKSQDFAKADADLISLEQSEDLVCDFYLSAKGVYGSDISWTSDNNAVEIGEKIVDPDTEEEVYVAHVHRPDYGQPTAQVTLSANVTYDSAFVKKDLQVTVKPNNPNEEIANEDLAYAKNLVQGIILEGYVLPDSGPNGSNFVWESDIENIVVNEDYSLSIARPDIYENDVEGKLFVTSTYKDASASGNTFTKVVPIDITKQIKEIPKIPTIECRAMDIPRFPNYIDVVLNDESYVHAYIKWPTDIEPGKVASYYTGLIVGTNLTVEVNVNIINNDMRIEKTAELFELEDIDLTGNSFLTTNREHDLAYLKTLGQSIVNPSNGKSVMRILYNFYTTFGIYTPNQLEEMGVEELGGWEEPHGLLRGHSIGHYISALSLAYASTQDAEIATILQNITSQLSEMQAMSSAKSKTTSADFQPKKYDVNRPYGDNSQDFKENVLKPALQVENWSTDPEDWGLGFISSYSPDQFVLLEMGANYAGEGSGIWAPYYTLHKLLAGFIEAYNHAPNEIVKQNALNLAKGTGLWAATRICKILDDPLGGPDQLKIMWDRYIAGEYGGMNEVLEKVYEICKDINSLNESDLETLKRGSKGFDNISLFGNLTRNIDGIKSLHANQHIPQIIGSIFEHASAFESEGQTTNHYFDIAKNFWEYVRGRYAYSTGGVGKGEKFTNPYAQAASIGVDSDKDSNCETCCVYNLLKLTAQLNSYDPDNAEYMDYYEKGLYNQIFASQCPDSSEHAHNGVTYMLPIGPGGQRSFGDDFYDFSCCCGTGMENHVKYQEATYFKSNDNSTLYVGLYLPTILNWSEKGVTVSQETNFPSDTSTIKVGGNGSFIMKLRVPFWATNGFSVMKNGVAVSVDAKPSTYVSVSVSAGDTIVVNMPWSYHVEFTPDKLDGKYLGSLMYGPYVMAAQNDNLNYLDLYLQNDVTKSVENVGVDSRGFPIIKTNGYTFYAMASAELAYKPYHAYSKITMLDNACENSIDFFYSSLTPFSPDPEPTPTPQPLPVVENGNVQTGDMLALFTLLLFAICITASLANRKGMLKLI